MFLVRQWEDLALWGDGVLGDLARRREMAIRAALGAAPHRVLTLVVREGAILACVGSAVGLLAAALVARAMQHVLFDIPAMDYATLGTVSAERLLWRFSLVTYPRAELRQRIRHRTAL